MKPLNDKELGEAISRKIASAESVKTDHLWAGIESGLPSSSSGHMTGVVKSLLFALTFTSVLTVSDSSGFAMNADAKSVQVEIAEASKASQEASSPKSAALVTAKKDYSMAIPPISQPELQLTEEIEVSSKVELQPKIKVGGASYIEPIDAEPYPHAFEVPQNIATKEELSSSKKWVRYISISSYLTFHKMEPHAFDENYVTSSTTRSVGLSNRVGVNVSYGYINALTKRWSVSGSIGIDYYQTQFNYRIANYIDSEVRLENHRIDAGLALGVGYRINSPVGQGTFQADIWTRNKIHSFNGNSSYNDAILGYRLSYLIDIDRLQVGPTFGSFINSNSNEMGRVKPMLYGFTIRRQLLKN